MEFFEILKTAKDLRSEMNTSYIKAKENMKKTRILNYDLDLKLYSKTTKSRNLIDFQNKNIMGLTLPKIKSSFKKKNLIERNKTIYSSVSIHNSIKDYEDVLVKLIIVAEVETTMIRILKEIERTKRRVNGLEFNTIPNLENSEKFVKLSLAEQENDNIIRLKKIKKKINMKN